MSQFQQKKSKIEKIGSAWENKDRNTGEPSYSIYLDSDKLSTLTITQGSTGNKFYKLTLKKSNFPATKPGSPTHWVFETQKPQEQNKAIEDARPGFTSPKGPAKPSYVGFDDI